MPNIQGNANKTPLKIDSDGLEEGINDKSSGDHRTQYEWGKWPFLARLFFIDVDPLVAYGYK